MAVVCTKKLRLLIVFNILLLLISQMVEVESSGALELTMNYFQNPSEHLDDGSCCDQFCAGECDDIFHFSLDKSSGNANDPRSYFYWTKTTGTFQDQNDVYFNANMNGVANPIVWHFDSWPGTVIFKVYIEDDDSPYSANDYLDGMTTTLNITPAISKSQAAYSTVNMYGIRAKDKTLLSMSYKLYCDDTYLGPNCSL